MSDGGEHDTGVIFADAIAPVSEHVNRSTHVIASNKMLTVLLVIPTWNDPEN